MSDHTLPPDSSKWPKDPHQLLGVGRGISSRDLRRAYLHLIRTYKPEHAPEEFRRIREAYETLLSFAESFPGGLTISEPEDEAPRARPSDLKRVDEIAPESRTEAIVQDPWDVAVEGDTAEAYRILSARLESSRPAEETYLQLYWLLVTQPDLDPHREPVELLARGIRTCGVSAYLLQKLLSHEVDANPRIAIGDQFQPLLSPGISFEALPDVVEIRWLAARRLDRWEVIHDDLNALRPRVSIVAEDIWTRLLIAAASNLIWAEGKAGRIALKTINREIKTFGRNTLELDQPLFQLDYAQELVKGLARFIAGFKPVSRLVRLPVDVLHERTNISPVFRRLFVFSWGKRKALISELRPLLARSWDSADEQAIPLIRSHIARVAKDPWASVRTLDLVTGSSSVVLTRLKAVVEQSGIGEPFDFEQSFDPLVLAVVGRFLASNRWWRYRKFRRRLLDFCLREMIHPNVLIQATADWPVYAIPATEHLSQLIAGDTPLIHVYQACAIHQS